MCDTETMACSCQQQVWFHWKAVTFSKRAPTTIFFDKVKNPMIETCNEYNTDKVDARTFPRVSVSTHTVV